MVTAAEMGRVLKAMVATESRNEEIETNRRPLRTQVMNPKREEGGDAVASYNIRVDKVPPSISLSLSLALSSLFPNERRLTEPGMICTRKIDD